MIDDTRFHRGRDSERLVNPNEVVPDCVQRDHVTVVLEFLRERIGEAREAAHVHPHREVRAFNVARVDVVAIRIARE